MTAIYREWINSHDEDRDNHRATDRTRISTSMMFSMPGHVNGEAVKDAVRALGEQGVKGRHGVAHGHKTPPCPFDGAHNQLGRRASEPAQGRSAASARNFCLKAAPAGDRGGINSAPRAWQNPQG